MSAYLLSMGASDFGIIVDGAVILVEHLFAEVPQRRSDSPERLMENIARARCRPRSASLRSWGRRC